MPPDLGKPYASEAQRAADIEALLTFWNLIETLAELGQEPDARWTKPDRQLFSKFGSIGFQEAPQQRLRRWVNVYSDEIQVIKAVRDRLVHGPRTRGTAVTDPEIRGAAWLAKQILATVTGVLPSEVNPQWAEELYSPLR
jgi:hypothetical protein